MVEFPNDGAVRAWTRLVRAHEAAMGRVERALKDAGHPPLAWYDALLELERAGGEGMRPGELEKHLLLPQYGLSRLLARLAEAGLIERRPCEDDARGHVVAITPEGLSLRKRMWPPYAAALHEALGSVLKPEEAEILSDLLQKIVEGGSKGNRLRR